MALPSEPIAISNTDDLSTAPTRQSLAPNRDGATTCHALCSTLLKTETDTRLVRVFTQGMRDLEKGLFAHFPHNIYGDLDYFAATVLYDVRAQKKPSAHLLSLFALTAELLELYGCHSTIHFRYAHDFLYGFDWARWARKAAQKRRDSSPFSYEFLLYLKKRGHELLTLIAKDDAKYPRLTRHQNRNPFAFSRTPDDEKRLHQTLAVDALVPVEAWRIDAIPRFDRDYSRLRAERAQSLHLKPKHG
ncbi:MAG: ferrochelatase [Candidatus Latescibacterota bacterium]|jgi:hypothetical protein